MATNVITPHQANPVASPTTVSDEAPTVSFLSNSSTTASVNIEAKAPIEAIRALFDHLHASTDDASKLNATYAHRGVMKTAALHKTESDQKFTIDLSPMRNLGFHRSSVIPWIPTALEKSSTSLTSLVLIMYPPSWILSAFSLAPICLQPTSHTT